MSKRANITQHKTFLFQNSLLASQQIMYTIPTCTFPGKQPTAGLSPPVSPELPHTFPSYQESVYRPQSRQSAPRKRPKISNITKNSAKKRNTVNQPDNLPPKPQCDASVPIQGQKTVDDRDEYLMQYIRLLRKNLIICVRIHGACWVLQHWEMHFDAIDVCNYFIISSSIHIFNKFIIINILNR